MRLEKSERMMEWQVAHAKVLKWHSRKRWKVKPRPKAFMLRKIPRHLSLAFEKKKHIQGCLLRRLPDNALRTATKPREVAQPRLFAFSSRIRVLKSICSLDDEWALLVPRWIRAMKVACVRAIVKPFCSSLHRLRPSHSRLRAKYKKSHFPFEVV